jgi:hypothetical protein
MKKRIKREYFFEYFEVDEKTDKVFLFLLISICLSALFIQVLSSLGLF